MCFRKLHSDFDHSSDFRLAKGQLGEASIRIDWVSLG